MIFHPSKVPRKDPMNADLFNPSTAAKNSNLPDDASFRLPEQAILGRQMDT
jgi:hypothetical protein